MKLNVPVIYSRHNIFSAIAESDNFFIVNPLSGSADILDRTEAKMLQDFLHGEAISDAVH